MREIGSLDLQLHQDQLDDNDADDSRLLDLYAQWELAWAQQEVSWAERNLAGMCSSFPNKSTHVDTKPLLHLCELERALACLGEPRTVFGARKLLGMTVKLLAYRMQHPESTRDQGPELQLVRNVNEALKWLDGQTRLYPHAQSDKVDADTKSRNHQAGPFELFRHAEKEHAGRSRPKRALPSPDANIIRAAPLWVVGQKTSGGWHENVKLPLLLPHILWLRRNSSRSGSNGWFVQNKPKRPKGPNEIWW
jgi:hypothetical protein